MALGRCPGCHKYTNGSVKKMNAHILTCPEYVAAFKANPQGMLTPAQEEARFQADDNSPEAKQAARSIRLETLFTQIDKTRAQQDVRWAIPSDPLADDDEE